MLANLFSAVINFIICLIIITLVVWLLGMIGFALPVLVVKLLYLLAVIYAIMIAFGWATSKMF